MLTEGAELSPISESISEQLLSAVRSVDLYLVHISSLYAFTSCSWLQRKPGQSKQRKLHFSYLSVRGLVEKMDYYRLSSSTEIFAVVRDLNRPLCNDGNRH